MQRFKEEVNMTNEASTAADLGWTARTTTLDEHLTAYLKANHLERLCRGDFSEPDEYRETVSYSGSGCLPAAPQDLSLDHYEDDGYCNELFDPDGTPGLEVVINVYYSLHHDDEDWSLDDVESHLAMIVVEYTPRFVRFRITLWDDEEEEWECHPPVGSAAWSEIND